MSKFGDRAQGVLFRGWGSNEARIAWSVIDVIDHEVGQIVDRGDARGFDLFMSAFVDHCDGLYPPVETWVITPHGSSTFERKTRADNG